MIGAANNLYTMFSTFPEGAYDVLTHYRNISAGASPTAHWLPCAYYFADHPPIYRSDNRQTTFLSKNKAPVSQTRNSLNEHLSTILKRLWLPKFIYLCYLVGKAVIDFYTQGVKLLKTGAYNQLLITNDNGPALISGYLLSRKFHIPARYYFFDLYRGFLLEPPTNWLARIFEPRIFSSAKNIIVNNQGTRDYYIRRYPNYQNKISVIHNSAHPENYTRFAKPYHPKSPYSIIFTGHVYWPQKQAILNLIQAMKDLEDLPLTLHLYIPRPEQMLIEIIHDSSNIQLQSAPQSEMPRIQSEATLLFLPLSWDTKAPDIVATATPGKFTDYLASGRPMLIHAPDYAYISQYAKQNNLGLVVDTNDITLLAQTIRDFLKNPTTNGQTYIENSLRIFYQNHDAQKNVQKLSELLNSV